MSSGAESFVFDPRGPVNTGPGPQFIGSTFNVDSSQRLRAVRDPRTVAHEHLRWLHQRFVEPQHYDRARQLLASNGSVLLTGMAGSGRRAAAQMLLHRLPGAAGQVRDLPETSDSPEEPVLRGAAVEAGQRLLLNLSDSENRDCGAVLGELPAFRALVQERGAHLVVVLPYSRKQHVVSELGPSAVDIIRPEGTEVFQRYLRSDGITFSREQLDVAELAAQLRSEPMLRISELAGLVRLASESEPTAALPHWLREALAALTERSEEVAKQMTVLRSGQQRALLLATAMFNAAHADAIVEVSGGLRAIVRHPADERPRLEREGVAEQLTEIGARADEAGRVRFQSLAYDQAVRTQFWTDFPDLRESLRNWISTAIGQPMLTGRDRDAVVTRFAEQALRTGRPDDLRYLIERWVRRTDPRWPSSLLAQAAKALEYGLNDQRHGFFFRRQLYTWAWDRGLSGDLAQVVVQVCSEVLALTHPDQAMVRLHHIFRRHSGAAAAAARDALLNLAGNGRHLYRFLLERVTRASRTKEDEAADLDLFLDLADPTRLTDLSQRASPFLADATVREQLVAGWRTVLGEPAALRGLHRLRSWLAACQDRRYRELLLDVLVQAGDGRDDVLSRLYVVARDWAHAPHEHQEQRSGIAARLTNKIDSAQGIDFTDPDPEHHTEGTLP